MSEGSGRTLEQHMAYRLKSKQSLQKGVARILAEQVERCRPPAAAADDWATWVHETRKAIKRMRALLRLVRHGLGKKHWRHHNHHLGSIAHHLRDARESVVARQTIDRLSQTAPPRVKTALDRLAKHRDLGLSGSTSASADVTSVALTAGRQLASLGDELAALKLSGDENDILFAGLSDAHATGRKWLTKAITDPDDDTLHELRKSVQVHWRHSSLLHGVWPELMAARHALARECAEALGHHQDLADIVTTARRARTHGLGAADTKLVIAACRAAQEQLRQTAIPAAERLFATEPTAYANEILQFWEIYRREGTTSTPKPHPSPGGKRPIAKSSRKLPSVSAEDAGARPSKASTKARSSNNENEAS